MPTQDNEIDLKLLSKGLSAESDVVEVSNYNSQVNDRTAVSP